MKVITSLRVTSFVWISEHYNIEFEYSTWYTTLQDCWAMTCRFELIKVVSRIIEGANGGTQISVNYYFFCQISVNFYFLANSQLTTIFG